MRYCVCVNRTVIIVLSALGGCNFQYKRAQCDVLACLTFGQSTHVGQIRGCEVLRLITGLATRPLAVIGYNCTGVCKY